MTEKDLIIQNQRRTIAEQNRKIQHLETMLLICKTQVEEFHQQIKRDRLALSRHIAGEDTDEQP